jgi:creatinine amidohydrolase
MSFYYADQTWEELNEYIEKEAVIILPVGTIEEHGKHLPLETDTKIATEIAREIASAIYEEVPVLVMPTVWSGYSPLAMNKWPGNMRIRPSVFTDMIHDILESLIVTGFKKIIMLDCHGQHSPMLNLATKLIADEYKVYAAVTSPLNFSLEEFNKVRKSKRGGVLHACEWETSVMMLYSDKVHEDKMISTDVMKYNSEFVAGDSAMSGQRVVWSTWGLQTSETGVYGDPSCASIETGKAIMKGMIENYKKFIKEYYSFK